MGTTDAHLRLNSRCQPGNATFTLQNTTPFTVRRSDAAGNILETKTFTPLPAVSQFHDSLGYYPGLWYRPANDGLYFWDAAASLVVPAKGNYTTKITWGDKTPATDLYGIDLGDTILGSGNPGDDGVQYGLHMAVLDKAKDGSWGKIKVWNSMYQLDEASVTQVSVSGSPSPFHPGELVNVNLNAVNNGGKVSSFVYVPLSPNVEYVDGSATNGAYAVTGAMAAALVKEHGATALAVPEGVDVDTVIGVAYDGSISTGETMVFSFQARVARAVGETVMHQAYIFAFGDLFKAPESAEVDIVAWPHSIFLPLVWR